VGIPKPTNAFAFIVEVSRHSVVQADGLDRTRHFLNHALLINGALLLYHVKLLVMDSFQIWPSILINYHGLNPGKFSFVHGLLFRLDIR
jgi:hypothetical protein